MPTVAFARRNVCEEAQKRGLGGMPRPLWVGDCQKGIASSLFDVLGEGAPTAAEPG